MTAGDALAKDGQRGQEVLLAVLAGDPNPRARIQALWSGLSIDSSFAKKVISIALKDAAPEVRGEAARLFGQSLPPDKGERDESHQVTVRHFVSGNIIARLGESL